MLMKFDSLGLYFKAIMAGLDGECFHYSVYLDVPVTDKLCGDIEKAINDQFEPFYESDDTYPGDVSVSNEDDMVEIELDLGNVRPDKAFQEECINGILLALNNVSGIQRVVLNEGCGEF